MAFDSTLSDLGNLILSYTYSCIANYYIYCIDIKISVIIKVRMGLMEELPTDLCDFIVDFSKYHPNSRVFLYRINGPNNLNTSLYF